ncbi:type II secretion system protein [Candidatus Saccharibacteria bacterium]|nr:type II secretion system protein [Candidatus Saccharibacteria bacterium]
MVYSSANKKQTGFTIVEVMIVLAIAGLVLLIIFLAIPALQRISRNNRRDNDARMIANAINECLTNNGNQIIKCQTANDIPLEVSSLSFFTGFHYGSDALNNSVPPTPEEPNWLFSLRCTADGTWFLSSNPSHAFVVTYERENASSVQNRCIDG